MQADALKHFASDGAPAIDGEGEHERNILLVHDNLGRLGQVM